MAVEQELSPALRELAASLPFLPSAWRRPGGLPDAATLIEFLRQWAERAQARLDELEGYLLAARSEPACAALAPQRALADLARVRAELSALEATEGAAGFLAHVRLHPSLLAAYESLMELAGFFSHPDRSRLVLSHRYLTDPNLVVPDGSAFADLRDLRATLLDMLARRDTFVQEDARRRFLEGFEAFLLRYKSIYIREHDRRRHPDGLAPYRRLRQEPAYRLMERLGRAPTAPLHRDFVAIAAQVEGILATQCPGVDEGLLDVSPRCTCGFTLGERAQPSVDELRRRVDEAVEPVLKALVEGPVCDHLMAVSRAAGGDRVQRLLELLNTWVRGERGLDETLERADALIDDTVALLVADALERTGQVLPRPLTVLVAALAGKDWTWEQLQEAVARWAFGSPTPRPGVVIRAIALDEVALEDAQKGSQRVRATGDAGGTVWVRSGSSTMGETEAGGSWPQTFGDWEAYYVRSVADGDGLFSERFLRAFRRFYRSHIVGGRPGVRPGIVALDLFEAPIEGGVLAGVRRPITLPLLLRRAARRRGERPLQCLWVDALRLDVWQLCRRRLPDGVAVLESGLLWAWPPATTAGQMARLEAEGISVALIDAARWPGPADEGTRSAAGAAHGREALPVLYLNALEDALRTYDGGRGDETSVVEQLASVLAGKLRRLLLAAPDRDWLLFGDHGFVTAEGEGHEAVAGRGASGPARSGNAFRQGGDSPAEVLVPWVYLREQSR